MAAISWDEYFINFAEDASKKSHCLRIKRGCVIVKDRQVLSSGYNGPPVGFYHCDSFNYRRQRLYSCVPDSNPHKLDLTVEDKLDICPRDILGFGNREGSEYCPATHSEMNAILQAARTGVSIKGASLYCNFSDMPCAICAKSIINSGLTEIVLKKGGKSTGTEKVGFKGEDFFSVCGIRVRYV